MDVIKICFGKLYRRAAFGRVPRLPAAALEPMREILSQHGVRVPFGAGDVLTRLTLEFTALLIDAEYRKTRGTRILQELLAELGVLPHDARIIATEIATRVYGASADRLEQQSPVGVTGRVVPGVGRGIEDVRGAGEG